MNVFVCYLIFGSVNVLKYRTELAWRSGSVMDCQATARCSIPGGNGVITELHVLRKEQQMGVSSLNDLAVDGT